MDISKKLKILIAEPKDFSQRAIDLLKSIGDVVCLNVNQAELKTVLSEYDVVWIRLGLTIREKDVPQYPRCGVIITATTGLNHLDLDALRASGIRVFSLKGQTKFLETVTATAELTMGLIFSLVRNIPAAHQSVIGGMWDRDLFKGNEIAGKKVGVVGYGRLGKIVASYCNAFHMKVIAYDPYVIPNEEYVSRVESMDKLFSQSDIVTLHLPLNAETDSIIDGKLLSLMKKSAFLINTSRGQILDENDLLYHLRRKKIAGAALDVICGEEFFSTENPLINYAQNHNNLLITPHIGGCTWESMETCELFMAKILLNAIP